MINIVKSSIKIWFSEPNGFILISIHFKIFNLRRIIHIIHFYLDLSWLLGINKSVRTFPTKIRPSNSIWFRYEHQFLQIWNQNFFINHNLSILNFQISIIWEFCNFYFLQQIVVNIIKIFGKDWWVKLKDLIFLYTDLKSINGGNIIQTFHFYPN